METVIHEPKKVCCVKHATSTCLGSEATVCSNPTPDAGDRKEHAAPAQPEALARDDAGGFVDAIVAREIAAMHIEMALGVKWSNDMWVAMFKSVRKCGSVVAPDYKPRQDKAHGYVVAVVMEGKRGHQVLKVAGYCPAIRNILVENRVWLYSHLIHKCNDDLEHGLHRLTEMHKLGIPPPRNCRLGVGEVVPVAPVLAVDMLKDAYDRCIGSYEEEETLLELELEYNYIRKALEEHGVD